MEEVLLSAARELDSLCDRAFWATEADGAKVVICFQFNVNLFLVLGYLGTWYHAFWAKEANGGNLFSFQRQVAKVTLQKVLSRWNPFLFRFSNICDALCHGPMSPEMTRWEAKSSSIFDM